MIVIFYDINLTNVIFDYSNTIKRIDKFLRFLKKQIIIVRLKLTRSQILTFIDVFAVCKFLHYDREGREKEQSRNIISGSDGKIIAMSTVGLTVGD